MWTLSLSVFFYLTLVGCTRLEPPASNQVEESPDMPDQQIWGWSSLVSESGRKRALVRAGKFEKFDQKSRLTDGVTVVFFNAKGDTTSKLSAAEGEIDEQTGQLLVSGGVVLEAQDSTRLETEVLQWDRKQDRITGDGKVTLRRAEGVETGIGFEASSDLKRWSMKQVVTRLRPSPSP